MQDTHAEGIAGLLALADKAWREIGRHQPATAALGGACMDALVTPRVSLVAGLRENPPADEDSADVVHRMAQALDLSASVDGLKAKLADFKDEQERLGPPVYAPTQGVRALRQLIAGVRKDLRNAGEQDHPWALRVLGDLQRDILTLEQLSPVELAGLAESALDRVKPFAHEDPPPPYHDLCEGADYYTSAYEDNREAMLALFAATAGVTMEAYETMSGAEEDLDDLFGVPMVESSLMFLLVGMGVLFLLMPFILYTPPVSFRVTLTEMCECWGDA